MARPPEVFVRPITMAEGQRLQRIGRTAKDPGCYAESGNAEGGDESSRLVGPVAAVQGSDDPPAVMVG